MTGKVSVQRLRRSITTQSEQRRAIARRVVERLAGETDLRASLLAGSAAHGTSDEHSDIDLINYYESLPDREHFDATLRAADASPMGLISAPQPEGFAARYEVEGIELQTGGQLITALERRLRRIEAGDVDWMIAKVAMGLLEGIALRGDDLIAGWKARAAYPDVLRRREVERNIGIFPLWAIDEHLGARDAELFRRQMALDGAFRVLAILSAVNRTYFSTFQFKRSAEHIGRLAIKPERLAEGLDIIANGEPSIAATELGRLVEETRAIVRAEMPEVDVEVAWQP
jgi:hypothetical protein